jgi:hypothetical protein
MLKSNVDEQISSSEVNNRSADPQMSLLVHCIRLDLRGI